MTAASSLTDVEATAGKVNRTDITEKGDAASQTADTEPEYPSFAKLVPIILALYLAVFLVALDQTIIGTAIPRITDQFKSISDIAWYGSAYFLTSTALQPSYGRIYKIFNVKWAFLVAITLFEIGSLICAVAPSSTALIVGRAIAGIGVAGIFSGAMVIIAMTVPLAKRPLLFGMFGLVWGVSSIAGPLLGGVFTDNLSWRWCFYINLPIGGLSIVVIFFFLHLPGKNEFAGKPFRERLNQLDLLGASLLIPAIICLLLALQWGGNQYPWNNSRIIGLFVGFGLLAILFAISQVYMGEKATLPPRILKQRSVLAAAIFAMLFGGAFFLLVYYVPIFFQSVEGSSAQKSGIQLLPMMLATVVSSVVMGGAITAVGYYAPFLIVSAAITAIGTGMITTYDVGISSAKWIGYQIIVGAGTGAGFQVPMTAVQTVLPAADIPVGTAIVMAAQTLGGALFIAVAQSVFQNGLISGVQQYAPSVNPEAIVGGGATATRQVLTDLGQLDQLANVIKAYMSGLRDAYRVSLALAVCAFVASLFLEWKSVKKTENKGEMVVPAL
ncbi:hypothetical protein N7539_001913 [Penicillium diatomitis]|uniref:Major facilitator superfamily (MFS) profile domain-containing protein n=1 Tax=Penicillium diatomitis TaxID=2819901 RepID=A0A9W9XHL2_9EURO|nr:uncharacterized protein N7539_001913 [Penicillium diatomitis]KAJ5493167.1 hypothetical protein N7539_001913 [Penicillium diatomitis]